MLFSRAIVYAILFVSFVMVGYACSARSDAVPGNVNEPAPQWKLRVGISTDQGTPIDTLVYIDKDLHGTKVWDSKADCEAFMEGAEYKASLPGLANFLVAQGDDPEHTVVEFFCVPVPVEAH